MKKILRTSFLVIIFLGLAGLIGYAFRPQPAPVDLAAITRGPLMVTVNEDGKTRIKERYVVSTPLAGQLRRIELEPGDPVIAGETVIATILPNNPDLLDPRAEEQARARVSASNATVSRAQANLDSAQAAKTIAEDQYKRLHGLEAEGATSADKVEDALLVMRTRQEEFRSAEFSLEIAKFELEQAESALKRFTVPIDGTSQEYQFEIHSPISGKVLIVNQESAAVVTAGDPLVELGDPANLELEIDVLSTDAVKIEPGDTIILEHWGGEHPLRGTVRLIEPGAFTKISALGVEEQRVFVIGDVDTNVAQESRLGDGFRFEARIVVWEGDDVLQVPMSALFRRRGEWAVFVVAEGKATRRIVHIGHRNPDAAEVLDGLEEGEQVVIYPSDRVDDGVAVAQW